MIPVALRPLEYSDLASMRPNGPQDDPFGFFGHVAANGLERRFAETGCISETLGMLVVDTADGAAGFVSWAVKQHGPSPTARALNVGIYLRPEFRGRGLGAPAQDTFARYLFDTTVYERLEAGTDVENVAEQKSLERAGFTREGVARHAQYRAGGWHDLVIFSRLRGD